MVPTHGNIYRSRTSYPNVLLLFSGRSQNCCQKPGPIKVRIIIVFYWRNVKYNILSCNYQCMYRHAGTHACIHKKKKIFLLFIPAYNVTSRVPLCVRVLLYFIQRVITVQYHLEECVSVCVCNGK